MHSAIQTFFVIQVALEHAASKITERSRSLIRQLVVTPLERSFTRVIGAIEKEDIQHLHSEIDSIRSELQGLRQDIRELQRSTTV